MAGTEKAIVFEGNNLRAQRFGTGGRRLFVSFTYMEPGRTGVFHRASGPALY